MTVHALVWCNVCLLAWLKIIKSYASYLFSFPGFSGLLEKIHWTSVTRHRFLIFLVKLFLDKLSSTTIKKELKYAIIIF